MQKVYDYQLVNTALCVWECLLEWTVDKPEWVEYRDMIGTLELRYHTLELAQWVNDITDLCIKNNPKVFEFHSFDWHVVPRILGYAFSVDNLPTAYLTELPSVEDIASKITAWYLNDRD